MVITFERRKQDCLEKDDKSSIGEWDKKIISLCKKINKSQDHYTLSSCAGRIVLIKNIDKKQPDMFVLRTHEKIRLSDLTKALKKAVKENKKVNLIFKQEPVILHIACKTLEDAEIILNKARQAGMKNSGIISLAKGENGRITLELRSTEYLSMPIADKGKILTSQNLMRILVKEANKRLEKSWEKIRKFEGLI